jgi:hypothetical protein
MIPTFHRIHLPAPVELAILMGALMFGTLFIFDSVEFEKCTVPAGARIAAIKGQALGSGFILAFDDTKCRASVDTLLAGVGQPIPSDLVGKQRR